MTSAHDSGALGACFGLVSGHVRHPFITAGSLEAWEEQSLACLLVYNLNYYYRHYLYRPSLRDSLLWGALWRTVYLSNFNHCANRPKGTRIDHRSIRYSTIYGCRSQHVTASRARDTKRKIECFPLEPLNFSINYLNEYLIKTRCV